MCANEVSSVNQRAASQAPKQTLEELKHHAQKLGINTEGKTPEQIHNEILQKEVVLKTNAEVSGALVSTKANPNGTIKGAELEKTAVLNDKNVLSKESRTNVSLATVYDAMAKNGFNLDDNAKAELQQKLVEAGVALDKEGNITVNNAETTQKLNTVLANYAKAKQEAVLQFTENTDEAFISEMVQDGAVQKNEDGTYKILDKTKVEKSLTKVDQGPEEVAQQPVELNLKGQTTTTTVKEEGVVDVAEDLKHNKAGRKQARKDFETALTEWADKPENQATMNFSIANNKYAKKITKQMDKIAKDCKTPEEILDKYYDEYATPEEKKFLDAQLNKAYQKSDEELSRAYRQATGDNYDSVKDNPEKRLLAAKLYVAGSKDFDSNVLLERMAIVNVMGLKTEENPDGRSKEQIAKDKAEFIKDEAKRQTDAAEARQNLENTKVYFSDEERKAAKENDKNSQFRHNDIGKVGRKLVNECPDAFCDRVDDPAQATKGIEPMKVVDPKTGEEKTVYFKFSQEKFDEQCHKWADPDNSARDDFAKDDNLTLNEGREAWKKQTLTTRDGKRRSLEEIVGNDNGKVGNRELNRLRDLVEQSGRDVDRNRTAAKRFGHFMKGVGIGAALGFTTGGLGAVAAGAIDIAGQTASQLVSYSGVTDGRIIKDSTKFEYTVDGEKFSKTVNKNIEVDGQEYSGQVEAEGQQYHGSDNKYLKTAANAAMFGGLAGGIHSLTTMGGVHAKGRNFDGVVDLRKQVTDEEVKDTNIKLIIPQSKTVTVRSGEVVEEKEIPTRPAVRYRGPEAYTVLYELDGAEIPAKYRKAVYQMLDKMWKAGTQGKQYDMPKNIPVYENVTIVVDGQEITLNRKADWDKIKINEGTRGNVGGAYDANVKTRKAYYGQGKITE